MMINGTLRRVWPFLVVFSISAVVFWCFSYLAPYSGVPYYGDQEIYIKCGEQLLKGLPPLSCNPEHPPLGKYLIGFFSLAQIPWVLNLIFYFTSIFALYYIFNQVSRYAAIYSVLLISTDSLVLNVFRHYLLDPSAFAMALLSLSLFIFWIRKGAVKQKRSAWILGFSGLLAGMSLASKWQSLFLLLIVPAYLVSELVYLHFSRGSLKWVGSVFTQKDIICDLMLFLVISLLSYFSTFVMDAVHYGFFEIFNHNLMMISYMGYRHSFSFPLAIIAFLKLAGRVEYWFYPGNISVLISLSKSVINSSVVSVPIMVNSTFTWLGKHYLIIYVGLGGVSWYLLMPSYFIYLWRGLVGKLDKFRFLMLALTSLSLINLLYGEFDWYYIYFVPFLYFLFSDSILTSIKNRGKFILAVLIAGQALQLSLALAGIIPWYIVKVI